MDIERTFDEIQQLQEMFEAPDIRPLSAAISWLRIDDMTKCSCTARGFGFGSSTEFVADLRLQ
jgi:hypothetical protein